LIEAAKMMLGVLQTILARRMTVHSGQDDRPTGAATGGGGKRVGESRTLGGQLIDVRSFGDRIAVTTQRGTLIVGNKQHDIQRQGVGCRRFSQILGSMPQAQGYCDNPTERSVPKEKGKHGKRTPERLNIERTIFTSSA
jgi:hypothetical protein